jgi:threonine/homoserine/homoserine lactone efflux protein
MAAVLHVLPGFLLATLALAMLPGPATALLIRETVTGDRRRTIGVIGGVEVGILAWALLSVAGVSALVAASTLAYTVLRAVGAVVLIALGLQTLWSSRRQGAAGTRPAQAPRRLLRLTGFRGGVLTNLANPKAAVFAFSFYPAFIPTGANVFATSALLGVVHVCVDVAWYTTLALAVSRLRALFLRPGFKHWLERVVGTVLVALGLRLAIE